MNKIIGFSLSNKFAVWLITIIVTAAGLYSGLHMKMETLPSINSPVVSITTIYPGAAPQDVMDKVSKPIEQRVGNLAGVDTVSSTSYANASNVQIQYSFDKNMDKAEQEVKDAVDAISFPEEVQDRQVSRLSFDAFPVMSMSISYDGKNLEDLTKLVEDEIQPKLEGIEGVSTVGLSGQQVEKGTLVFNQKKMKKLGLQEDTVENIIKGSNIDVPLGLYNFSDKQKALQINGKTASLKDFENLRIPVTPSAGGQSQAGAQGAAQGQAGAAGGQAQAGAQGGQGQAGAQGGQGQAGAPGGQSQAAAPGGQGQMQQQAPAAPVEIPTVKLSDIASIKITGKADSISRTNGKESIGVQVTKATDANTVEVVNAVKDQMKKYEKQYSGLKSETIFDQGQPIEESVQTMLNKAIVGAIFAVLIILLFLRNFKSTIISIVSIPLSLLIAVLLLKQMDISLNIMTLGAMTVAIGRVVDDSIVVIENIYRRMSLTNETLRGGELIRAATKEMFMPIMSSTIVTIAVFLPLGLVKGPVGELFFPFALTIVFALLASLLVAVTIVPAMAGSLFKKGIKAKNHEDKPGRLAGGYRSILNWSLNHKIITFLIALAMLAGSLFLVPHIGVSFIPAEKEKRIIATYSPAPGEKESDVEDIASDTEKYFLDKKAVNTVQFSVGGENPMNPGASNEALFFVNYEDNTKNFDNEKDKVLKDLNAKAKGGVWGFQDVSSSGSSSQTTVNVYGDSLNEIQPTVSKIEELMKKQKDLTNIDSSVSESYDQYSIVPNQEKLSKLGLTAGQLGMQLSNSAQGSLTTIEKDGKEVEISVERKENEFSKLADLENRKIQTPVGREVALKDVADIKTGKSPDTITTKDGKIHAEVSADIKTSDVGKATAALQKDVEKLKMPGGVSADFGGVTEQINDSFSQLGLAMLAAIAIVYLVLVITFGGGLAPFAILFSLPFTVIGGLAALYLAKETISISALIGALMLIGIVVTNAIVLVDRVIHKQKEGMNVRQALLEAGATRLRPILMTAIATVGALIPLAIGTEGGGLISRGLGVTVIGGLISSTLLTLVIVPVVYEFLLKLGRKDKKRRNRPMPIE
ncbi:efflux RND transporter permease subunit [Metabacillus sp. GX 13764]|uniref:efflux RND transporter permease subunit n=1 Tax=Metabacillus kandeliae TaxID=2900151 RepID=UPI001E4C4C0B|nr:efflux RND transporter permease subunit [Metabacillus kandeliae]MCD7035902.1 efflux RND transporter permease subunit [Metabacillus kandeliae]